MSNLDDLVDRHVREYEMRLKHLDDMLDRAREKVDRRPDLPDAARKLSDLEDRRGSLAKQIREIKDKTLDHWEEKEVAYAGPMAIWDIVAIEIEHLIERLERKPNPS